MPHDHASHAGHSCGDVAGDRRVLWIVLALNFTMFLIELWYGFAAGSSALIADAADFLSDSLSYVITLLVMGSSLKIRASASLLKAALMVLLAAVALAQGAYHLFTGGLPHAATMGWVSVLALAVNAASAFLLYRTRTKDSNMLSVWLCSRNDAINNALVIVAALVVAGTQTIWPDLIIAAFIAWLSVNSALKIIRSARLELRHPAAAKGGAQDLVQ